MSLVGGLLFLFTVLEYSIILVAKAENDPISIFDGQLVLSNVISSRGNLSNVDEKGFLTVFRDDSIFSFSMDVGFNRGQTSLPWLTQNKNMFVIGVEANDHLVTRFERSPEFDHIRDREFIFQVAAGSKPGIARFNPGFGWDNISDTGSLFHWSDKGREKQRQHFAHKELLVRIVRLESILDHVPPPVFDIVAPRTTPFIWDTLKVDVQGADVDAVHSVGASYIKRFMCIVGEFETGEYKVPAGFPIDPAPFLKENGFVKVHNQNNQIWLNKLFIDTYRKNAKLYNCHTVYDSPTDPHRLLQAYDAGGVK